MSPARSGRREPQRARRRARHVAGALALVAALLPSQADHHTVLAGGRPPGQPAARPAAGRLTVTGALRRRLDREHLTYAYVVCVRTAGRYAGHRVWRCNVNFGDPHVVQYCAVLIGTRLLTDHEHPAIRCGRGRETYGE